MVEVEDRTNKPKANNWQVVDAGAAGALAAFGAVPAMGFAGMGPYGQLSAAMPGLAMPGAVPMNA